MTKKNIQVSMVGRKRTAFRRTRNPSDPSPYPEGCIGADVVKRSYIKHLVERYHRCREADAGFGRIEQLRYATLFRDIESRFKAPTYFISEGRFEKLADYLQTRIDRTLLGRRNASRGVTNYESFDEYKVRAVGASNEP